MFVSLVLALLSVVSEPTDPAAGDARLNDVCFVDARNGWAVGDRGVIWRTDDGGQQWQLQNSGVRRPLWAVTFLDEQTGWAAGGFTHPFTHVSSGVLLSTRDGGKTWTANPKLQLPSLRRMRFFDARHGWVLGCRSAMYPSGLFVTSDGGRQWRPLPGGTASDWMAADFFDLETGAVSGRRGEFGTVSQGQIEASRSDAFGLRRLTQIRLVRPTFGWLVGDGGLVCLTGNIGSSWGAPPGALPDAARQFDFAALAVRGPRCWVAGSPGTRVFHTADAGRTWAAFATGSNVPLRAIAFGDDQHGWAVGELGTILATADGGRSWQRQHSGGDRAALLALLAEPETTPLELIAHWAGDEGYLTAVEALGRRDLECPPRGDVDLSERFHEAVVGTGGSSTDLAWRFPLRQAGLPMTAEQIVEAWNRANEGQGRESLQAHLVRQIRIWRPEVIVTHDAQTVVRPRESERSTGDAVLNGVIQQAVLLAVGQAADANAFPAQVADAGLAPWAVKRVFGVAPPGARAANGLPTSQFAPRLGRSLAEASAEPRGLLADRFTVSPPTLGFRLLFSTAAGEQDGQGFFSGAMIPSGSPARRAATSAIGEGLDLRQRIAQKRRHVQAILEHAGRTAGSAEQLLAQVDELTRDLDDEGRGQILFQLADGYYRSGRWRLAAETFSVLSQRYPQHPLTPQAMLWLLQYNASAEAAWRIERGSNVKGRLEKAVAMGQQIERTRPELFAEPVLCFPLATAYRGLDQTRQAERVYQMQGLGGERGAWSACAQSERQMAGANPSSRDVKPVLPCIRTAVKPRLDGVLDDPVWQQAKPAALQSAQHDDGDWPAAVMLACDDEFLYLGARCQTRPNEKSTPNETGQPAARPRDADLSDHDRIEVLLDTDRDFTTFYRLAIDDRGWTNDACWDDKSWNPKWFVASKREATAWTIEAAIPLVELAGRPPAPGDRWAIGVQRVVPDVGFQAWSAPAAVSVLPDGFGYLAFQ